MVGSNAEGITASSQMNFPDATTNSIGDLAAQSTH
jgi:hypothetical protein